MPKLIIDNRKIEVPEGTKVIEAAEKLGIIIPRFCYHPALGAVGACRVCAVKVIQGPVKGVQMSCMIDARDDMVVSTTDEEAMDFRMHVIEWLMLNHPHDCPVCDEGGHCLLQDMTVSGGHGIRRYAGKKRTHRDQHLGPLLQHEMNRCIQCYRCSRFYQEYTGYRDLGVMQIGSRVYFGRYKEGTLESPFAGNLADICPTGVYTDKPSRYKGRRWDFERSPSVCIHCSLGCRTATSVRYRQVVRTEAGTSEAVNGHFICDRGRHGFPYANDPERPRTPLQEGREVSYEQALVTAVEKLNKIAGSAGPMSVAGYGSTRSTLATQASLHRLLKKKAWSKPVFFTDTVRARRARQAVDRLEPDLRITMQELASSDFILAVGADPVNEAPVLALAMRQAQRRGARIAVLDGRPVQLPLPFQHVPASPSLQEACLGFLVKQAVTQEQAAQQGDGAAAFYESLHTEDPVDPAVREIAAGLAKGLEASSRPVIVCGTDWGSGTPPGFAADCILLLRAAGKDAGLFFLLPGANAFGAALLSNEERSLELIVQEIEQGRCKALILVETNPFHEYPDRKRLARALEALDFLLVMDYVDSPAAKQAAVVLPTTNPFESGGIFINQEGRAQEAAPTFRGGTPILQVSGGDHPPRTFRADIPGGAPRDAWRILGDLAGDDSNTLDENVLFHWIKEAHPSLEQLPSCRDLPEDGVSICAAAEPDERFAPAGGTEGTPEKESPDMELLLVDRIFGTEELSCGSSTLQEVENEPVVFMHAEDAARLGFKEGDRLAISSRDARVECPLCIRENMARDLLVLPRHHRLAWQDLGLSEKRLKPEQITRSANDQDSQG